MTTLIKKFYFSQIIISTGLTILTITLYGVIKGFDESTVGRLFMLSLFPAALFGLLNSLINWLNFTYLKGYGKSTAFHIPLIIWTVIFLTAIIVVFRDFKDFAELVYIILWMEPIVYSLMVKKAAANNG